MTGYDSLRILPVKLLQKMTQRYLLSFGAGVGGMSGNVEATLVADADTVAVVVLTVEPIITKGRPVSTVPLRRTT